MRVTGSSTSPGRSCSGVRRQWWAGSAAPPPRPPPPKRLTVVIQSRKVSSVKVPRKLKSPLGVRFARFAGAAAAALTATEVALTVGNGVLHLTATPAALVSWFAGAVVSYALSRWAWNRTGRPSVLRETIPFWVISGAVIVLLTLANKLGYRSAAWLHLTGV